MTYTVKTIEMNYVMVTFSNGIKAFYSLDEMTLSEIYAKVNEIARAQD